MKLFWKKNKKSKYQARQTRLGGTARQWLLHPTQRTSGVTQMIKDLNWRTLEQRRIDSRHTLMVKITYDLLAIPAAAYLIPNTRQSRHNHLLAYRQIPTLKDYYKYTFFPRTIVHWNALRFTFLFSCFTYCGTVQSCCVPNSTRLSVDIRSAFTI